MNSRFSAKDLGLTSLWEGGWVPRFRFQTLRCLLLSVILGFAFLIPCQGAPPGKTLVLVLPSDPKSFNPVTAQESTTHEVGRFLFEGLVRFNPLTGAHEGDLASHWSVSDDGSRWIFYLRPEIYWSDGNPVTAEDVIFTFNSLIYNPLIVTSARDVFTFEGEPMRVSARGQRAVSFELPAPFAPFLFIMQQPILPKHILDEAVKSGQFMTSWGVGEDVSRIVGSGPFKLHQYSPGERISLTRNPFYGRRHRSGVDLPRLDRIVLWIFSGPDGGLLKFLEGQSDIHPVSGGDYPVLKTRESGGGFTLYSTGPGMGSNFLVFNQGALAPHKKAWFQNRAFRTAVAHSIDREAMIDIVLNGLGSKQCGPVSPSAANFFNPDTVCHEFDPVKSREILAREGFLDRDRDGILEDREGNPVRFVMLTNAENSQRLQIVQMIREDLSRLGFEVYLQVLDFNSLVVKLLNTRDWDAVLIGMTGTLDPHFGANVWLSSGTLHFWGDRLSGGENPAEKKIDQIFHRASRTLDVAERKSLYDEWQMIVSRELMHIYTILPEVVYAVRDRVRHVTPTAAGGALFSVAEIDKDP